MAKNSCEKYSGKTLCENLNRLMEGSRLSMSQLHRNTGVAIPTIQRMRDDPSANPTISSLKPIADFFNLTVNQLIGDEPLPMNRIAGSYQENKDKWVSIPIISWEEAITWPKNKIEREYSNTISTDIDVSKNAYALKVEEDNWINLATGTILIIDPEMEHTHRDFLVVYSPGEKRPSIKQILFDDADRYLKPVIHGYQIVKLTSDYKFLGVIVEYKMSLR